MTNSNNYKRSRMLVVMDHPTLNDKQLKSIMQKMAKVARGRSGREISIECGGLVVWAGEEFST